MKKTKIKKVKKCKHEYFPDGAVVERVKYKSCIEPPAERVITYLVYKSLPR